ncbi:MAG: amidase, partial [Chloroflexota bacterium]|nr:amidase [Chloroflexota bacterium]
MPRGRSGGWPRPAWNCWTASRTLAADARLHELTAAAAAELIRRRELSPVELIQALLSRIELTEPKLQAWETLDAERALEQARRAEQQPAEGPLHGVPFGAKDIYHTAGLRTTASFEPFANFVPQEDAEPVARLKRSGAIVLGKTVTTQFAMVDPPRTTNPWNSSRTPGGSSSGSGAAVAARNVPFALGTQTAGSVLRPAAYCGVVGFKPTFGRISRRGIFPLGWTLDHVGVICRSVEDAALTVSCMAGHDRQDPFSAPDAPEDLLAAVHAGTDRPPVLGLVHECLERAQPEVRSHVEAMARRLAGTGAEVREVSLPSGLDTALAAQHIIMRCEVAEIHAHLMARERQHYAPRFRSSVEVGSLIPGAAYVHALRLRRRFRDQVEALMEGVDVLLAPTATNVAPDPSTTGDASLQTIWTMLGLPTISLPSGLTEERLPLAIQLVGRRLEDNRLLVAAGWCERMLGPMPAP